ncbi:MAG: arginyl-tRNA synthetase, partial [Cryptosporangiaceae bacterium]|nr:arginyl-tRNA synthetase [Cryptosporangiaceae bacterium]
VLGPDGTPFKTRAGGTVRLAGLLDEAVDRAREVAAEKNPGMDPAALDAIAEQLGIGAVKYADLSTSRTRDYVFDAQRMVSLTGDTGVYLQYAHARIRSILAKADGLAAEVDPSLPLAPAERRLVLALDEFGCVLAEVAAALEPHRLCGYLFGLAKAYSEFYETCPVLTAPDPLKGNRIVLCELTARTLHTGLGLLGIAAPSRL